MALCVRNYPALLQIWPNLPDCFVGCFLCVNAKHRRKTTCRSEKWFALKARKLPLKLYDARNTSVYHTLRLEFCIDCMLSLNMGLAGLSEITRMSEIRRLYPTCLRIGGYYSIHVPGWLQKWLNLITAPGSVSNEPGSVTWLATKYFKTVSWKNYTEKLTTLWPQNISFWPKINIPSSYFPILMLNCLENTLKPHFDS